MMENLRKKIGALFMVGIPSESVTEEYEAFCKKHYLGNFCISASNAVNAEGLCKVTADLRRIALRVQGEYPFIAIDQEGGWVTRFYEGAGLIPGAMAYAACGADGELMERVGARMGKILRALGCNINNAPVLDVNMDPQNPIIGTRSYGDLPQQVVDLGVRFAKGIESEGVITAVKHFPGHGNVSADTHTGIAVNHVDGETLRKTEFVPFARAFEAGVGATMTAHVTYSAFSDRPATLSHAIMTDLLRHEMGFEGVVITDSMMMQAVGNAYPNGEAAVLAIEAGCDQILYYPFQAKNIEKAIDSVIVAVESGRITEERINESLARIARQKQKYAVDKAEPDIELVRRLIFDKDAAQEIFEEAVSGITCLKD